MADDKQQAFVDLVERMRPTLAAASTLAHKLKQDELQGEKCDDCQDFDRIVELGYVIDHATDLCEADLMLVFEIIHILCDLERIRVAQGGKIEPRPAVQH